MEKIVELINKNPNWTLIRATSDKLVSFSFDLAEYIGAKHKRHEREMFMERLFNETIKPLVENDICYFYEKEDDNSHVITMNLYSNRISVVTGYEAKLLKNSIPMVQVFNEPGVKYLMIKEVDSKVVSTTCYTDLFLIKLYLQFEKQDPNRIHDYKVFKVDLSSESVFDNMRAFGNGELITFLVTR